MVHLGFEPGDPVWSAELWQPPTDYDTLGRFKKEYFLKNIGFAASAKVFTKSKVFEKKVSKRDIPINWVLIMI